jgi:hypothetical protein
MIKEEGYFSKEAFNADNTSYQMWNKHDCHL